MSIENAEDIPDLDSLTAPSGKLVPILQKYSTDRRTVERKYPVPLSEVCRSRYRRFISGWLDATELIDFDSLNRTERIEYILFQNHLRFCMRCLGRQDAQFQEMAHLIPFATSLLNLEEARRSMAWAEPEAAADQLNRIQIEIEASQRSLEQHNPCDKCGSEGASERSTAKSAAEAIDILQSVLKDWYTFYHGFDPMFTWWVESPYSLVNKALDSYRACIAQTLTKADDGGTADIIGQPLGREALTDELRFEMIPYSPEELIEIANIELAWCEAEMAEAASEMGFGSDIRAAVDHVKTLHAPPGGQPELIKSLALEAIEYVDEHELLTVPALARESWRLEMMSQEKQRVNPFFLGGEVIQVSFPTHTMTHEEKQMSMRGNNAHFARATVQHELIPGHHLQGYMQERFNTHRRPFHTPFWVEGWTIYWEFLLYKTGFPKCAEDRVGMLFWRMHRCARIIFSLSFHLEKMTPQQCIELLVDRVGHERANAEAEVRRSCGSLYPPLYQCAYLIGGLQMWALRKELVDTGKMAERDFHDAVIQENCIPIEMIRADLMGVELPKDFTSNWRFYGEVDAGKLSSAPS